MKCPKCQNKLVVNEEAGDRWPLTPCSRSSDVRECGEVTVSRNGYIEQMERERYHLQVALARLIAACVTSELDCESCPARRIELTCDPGAKAVAAARAALSPENEPKLK